MLFSKMSSKQIFPIAVTTTIASLILFFLYLIGEIEDFRITFLLVCFAVASWIRFFLSKRKEKKNDCENP